MQKLLVISLIAALFGCIDKSSLKPIVPNNVLNANSSKVWILQERMIEGKDETPQLRERKRTFTFFDDFQFLEQEMVHLGSNFGLIGSYSLNIEGVNRDTTLNLYYTNENKKLQFKVTKLGYKTLRLTPITNNAISEEWGLIPLNKPN